MKKLNLNVEDLAVESFDTTSVESSPRGTIHGADVSETTCQQIICDCETNGRECDTNYGSRCEDITVGITCAPSCTFHCSHSCPANTCAYSCEGTCGCPTWSPNETCGIC